MAKNYFTMKNIFIIFFFIGLISGIYADDKKAITLTYIGEQDAMIDDIVINTYKDGLELVRNPYPSFVDYYLVQESTFDEIISLINNNTDLFGNKSWGYLLKPENGEWSLIFTPDENGNLVIPIEILRRFGTRGRRVVPSEQYDNTYSPIPFKGILEFLTLIESNGCFELLIENAGEKYYRYLVKRESSALFFSKLYKLMKEKEETNRLIAELESLFRYFYFIQYIPEIGNLD